MSSPQSDEPAEAEVRSAVQAATTAGASPRDVLAVLIAWGLLFDDIQGMDDTDQQVLAALQGMQVEATEGEPDPEDGS